MPVWKTTLSYDGTDFHGWQVQPELPTVQGSLSDAIFRVTGERVLPQGSGRTDTGVHALGQVASFSLQCAIPGENLHRALNRILPPSIRVLSVEAAHAEFHARHSARRKTYEYRIFPRRPVRLRYEAVESPAPERICSPMEARFLWDCGLPLELTSLGRAAAHILGTHDFTSFAASSATSEPMVPAHPVPGYPETPPTPERTVHASGWAICDGLLIYRVTGSGFLHHMVRNLVGTFVDAGCGRIDPDSIPAVLRARDRAAAGPTAPARGLFLREVEY